MAKRAILVLEDGTLYEGDTFGAAIVKALLAAGLMPVREGK